MPRPDIRTRTVRLSSYLALIGTLLIPSAACLADDVLTLELPSSRAPEVTSTESPTATQPNRRATSDFMEYSRKHSTQPSRHAASRTRQSSERTVGRLGVTRGVAAIHSGRNGSARVLVRVQGGTYLALTYDSGEWYGILMADRSTGWMRKADVNVLNYEVVSSVPAGGSGGVPQWGSGPITASARTLLQLAYQYLGVPYRYGGTSANGIDCSAFVQRCFRQMGIDLPRTAAEQSRVGMPVGPSQLQAGDRLYFANGDGRVVHTGIYIQNGYFIHASASTHKVSVSRLSESLYTRMYAGARR